MNSALVFAAGMSTPLAIVLGMCLVGAVVLLLVGGVLWLGLRQEARDQADANRPLERWR